MKLVSLLWDIYDTNENDFVFLNKSCKKLSLVKFYALHKSITLSSMVKIVFCDSWYLPILISVNIGTCHVLGHKF